MLTTQKTPIGLKVLWNSVPTQWMIRNQYRGVNGRIDPNTYAVVKYDTIGNVVYEGQVGTLDACKNILAKRLVTRANGRINA